MFCGNLRADVTSRGCLDPESRPRKNLAFEKLRKKQKTKNKTVAGGKSSKERHSEMARRNRQDLGRAALSDIVDGH